MSPPIKSTFISDLPLVRLTDQVRLIKRPHHQLQGHLTSRRFSSIANAANVQLSTQSGGGEEKENRRYISAEHAMTKSEIGKEMQREALSSESLGTTHCCHYITLHYIHQLLHLWSCGRPQNRWLSLRAAAVRKNSPSFGSFVLFPLLPSTAVFKATCVTLNLTKSVWGKAEVFCLLKRRREWGSEQSSGQESMDECRSLLNTFFSCILQTVKCMY